jgi:hypothetical protein
MDVFVEIVKWIVVVAGGFAIAGVSVVAAMAWLLNRPIDDARTGSRRPF